jgi:hypothetical protein
MDRFFGRLPPLSIHDLADSTSQPASISASRRPRFALGGIGAEA